VTPIGSDPDGPDEAEQPVNSKTQAREQPEIVSGPAYAAAEPSKESAPLVAEEVAPDEAAVAVESSEGGAPAGPVRTTLRQLDWRLIGMILAIKGVFYIYGTQAYQALTNSSIGSLRNWLGIWNRWDAVHYINLAENGYQATGEARFLIIFYPLFPWLTRLVALVFGNYIFSGLVVAGIASIAAGLLLQKVIRLDYEKEFADRTVWLMFIFPTSYALHVPYTESLLISLALGSFLMARTDRWLLAGALGALACLSRINGLVLVPALAVEAAHQYWVTRRWRWQWLWIGLVGLGVFGYLLLNYHVTGNPFMFMTYRREHWYQVLSWPWEGVRGKILEALHPTGAGESWVIVTVHEILFIALGFVATVWACIKLRPSYAAWMIGNWLLFTSTTFIIGVSRFTLVMFPLFILFSALSARRIWYTAITVASLLYLALFTGLYVEGHWVS
jgi:hypothetical protein